MTTVSEGRVAHARLVVVVAAVVVAAAILWLSRAYTFYFDEWDFILTAPDWTLVTFLQPHNEHPSILFKAVYGALLILFGMRTYLPYMSVLMLLHVTDVLLLFELVRRRAGDLVALGAGAVLIVLGAGWEDLLWAFQLAWLASIACGLGMLLLLEGEPTRRRLPAAVLLGSGSLMFSGIGLPFLVAAVVRLLAAAERRRDLLWFVPLGVALAAWYLAFGRGGTQTVPPPTAMNLVLMPAYLVWGLGAGAAGLIGVTGAPEIVVLAPALAVLAMDWRRRKPDPLDLGVAAALLSFYVVTGLARAQFGFDQSASGRYVYIGAVFWLILLAGPARRLPWHGTWRPALAACLFLACFNSSVLLVAYSAGKAQLMEREVADLQALAAERTDSCLNPTGAVDLLVMPQVTRPALYYRAVDRYGDPTVGRPITDRADFDNAKRNLTRSGCATP